MKLKNERIALIGCGTMGEAMIKGLLREKLVTADQRLASHPRDERRDELSSGYGIETTADNAEAARSASLVVLTVKPQVLAEVLADLQGRLSPDTIVVTIVAGVRLGQLSEALGTAKVARAMPNTPGQIGRGITVWTAAAGTDDETRAKVRALLSALGTDVFVKHENELDMATALSGTGPAYVFLFMEALIDAGVHLGFSRRVASKLVLETVRGAVTYAAEAPEHLAKMRNQVTSPGGTTAEAHYQLEKGGLRTVLADAVWAAYRRCVALGEQQEPAHDDRPYRRS